MHTIGEIKRGIEIGKANESILYKWAACSICKAERWVALRYGILKSLKCFSCANKTKRNYSMAESPLWKGGRYEKSGYVYRTISKDSPYYCMADAHNGISEHRLVMAQHLGRPLKSWEVVHHINGNKIDNQIENLELLPNRTQHYALTRMQQYITSLEAQLLELTGRLSQYEEVN